MAEDRSRSRTYVWNEPTELARTVRPLSGLEFMEAWSRGEVTAPFQATIAFELSSFGDGEVELTCTPDEFHFNPYGTVHGGLVASLLDTATGCAIHPSAGRNRVCDAQPRRQLSPPRDDRNGHCSLRRTGRVDGKNGCGF